MEPIVPGQPGDFGEPERLDTAPESASPSRARTVVVAVAVAAAGMLVVISALAGAGGSASRGAGPPRPDEVETPAPTAAASTAIDWPTPRQPSPTPTRPPVFGSSGFLAELDLDVFVRSNRAVFRIETRAKRVTRTPVDATEPNAPVQLLTLADRVLVLSQDGSSGVQVVDGQPASPLPGTFSRGQQYLPGPSGRIWSITVEDDGRSIARLVDPTGRRVYETIRGPGYGYFRTDGAAGLLYDDTGGVYRASGSGMRRITPGSILVTGPSGYLATECTERFECATYAYRSGPDGRESRRRVGPAQHFQTSEGKLSPNGRYAAILSWQNAGPTMVLYEVEHGRRIVGWPMGDYAGGGSPPFAWLPDGRLISLQNSRLTVLDPRTKEAVRTTLRLPPLTQLAVRQPGG